MLKPGQEPTFDDLLNASVAPRRSPAASIDDAGVPTRLTSRLVRSAAMFLLILFFLPWGSIWISSDCGSRSDVNTLGTVSGWDLAAGKDFERPTPTGRSISTITLEAQREALAIPLIAVTIITVSILARAGSRRQSTAGMYVYYTLAFVGSIACQIVASVVVSGVSVPPEQASSLGPASSLPAVALDTGGVFVLQFLTLSVLGICGIVGVLRMRPVSGGRTVDEEAAANEAWYRAQVSGRQLT
jgi:hypothetical protein